MKCYNHHDRDAFGIELITGKALCLECLEEYKGMIIEKNSEFSKKAAEKILMGYEQLGVNKKISKIVYISFSIIGIFLIISGILSFFTTKAEVSSLILGFIFFIVGLSFKRPKL